MLESFYVQDKVQTLELAYEQMNIMVMDCLDEGKSHRGMNLPEVINWTVESRQMQSGC